LESGSSPTAAAAAAAAGGAGAAAASSKDPAALPSPVAGDDGGNTSIPKATLEKIVLVRSHSCQPCSGDLPLCFASDFECIWRVLCSIN
jgi:hypothetical protein